jgi:hypothetical protein
MVTSAKTHKTPHVAATILAVQWGMIPAIISQ